MPFARGWKNRDPRDTHSRNPGRRDGFRWNADAFICPASVDGFRRDARDATAAATYDDADPSPSREEVAEPTAEAPVSRPASRHEVALMDIARHTKAKGVAKDFEVLDAPRRVIALDEDAFMDEPQSWFVDDDSEWEDIDEFAGVHLEAGTSAQHCEADDYLLARRLQDEGDARYAHERRGSGTRRRAYVDVAAAAND
ncbi:hypothetical protein B0H13DRAFT_1062759 [Mycena leptocephala]|nr:hypothetical protein B0H13DRAFT_1062759 [Mycena leptocephala]